MNLKDMTIGIVGKGVLGTAMVRGLVEHVKEVRIQDIDPAKQTHEAFEVVASDFVFLCLPTPEGPNGVCDTSALDEWFEWFAGNWGEHTFKTVLVIRSTVPVGYTQSVKDRLIQAGVQGPLVAHMPEFLTARCSNIDFHCPSRHVIGWTTRKGGERCQSVQRLRDFFETRFPGTPVFAMPSAASEISKLAMNGFFGLKVAYFNMVAALCDSNGVEYEKVLKSMLADGRIANSHVQVPGPDGKCGFGGTCLPKDIADLAHCMEDAECYNARDFLNRLLFLNDQQRHQGKT